jgi:hypothetical protein
MKKQIFIVDHGTYPFDVMVCIGSSHEEVVKAIKKRGCKLDEEETEKLWMSGRGRTIMLRNGATILRMDKFRKKADFYPYLFHEIFHVVEFLFHKIGLKHEVETSGEAFAYQIQYLTGSILEQLNV